MDLQLTDRVFIVTAASGGLGFATAQSLVAEGARVVLVARREEVLAERVSELGGDAHAIAITGDLTDPTTPVRACEAARDTWDRLDGAFISVGGPPAGLVGTNTDDEWRKGFESVFLATVRTIDTVLEYAGAGTGYDPCGKGGPVFGLVLSSSVRVPIGNLTISNGLRPGLANLVSQYATRFGPVGARFFGLMPGNIMTDRFRSVLDMESDPKKAQCAAEGRIPLGRIGDPKEFGDVAAFLMSPMASYVTGCVVPVDGGMLPMA